MTNWKETTLGEVATIIDSLHKTPQYSEKGYPMVRVTDIKPGYLSFDDCLRVDEKVYREFSIKYKAKSGDIVFSRVGSEGIASLVKDETEFCLGQNTVFIIPNEKFNKFLYYWLNSPQGKEEIRSGTTGSTQRTISLRSIKELRILLPPLPEQKAIAQVLSSLDDKIELLRGQNETLEKMAQVIFKEWFGKYHVGDELPKGWRFGKLGDEIETLGGGTPSTKNIDYWIRGDISWYSPTDLTKFKTMFSLDADKKITEAGLRKSSAKLFPAYSLLMTSRATVGEVAINTREACTNQGFITLIPTKELPLEYLHSWLKTQIGKVKTLASGSTFPEISKSTFREFEILVPPGKIMDNFISIERPIYKKIELNIKQIQTLTRTRDTLLPKLMSGEVRVKL